MNNSSSNEPQPSRKSIKPALLALCVLIVLLILGKVIAFATSLGQPYTPGFGDPKGYSWNGKSSYNLVYAVANSEDKKVSSLAFINFEPYDQKITVLHIDDSIYATIPRGYGDWPVGSIYPLGQEGGKKGPLLLQLSMAQLVGLPVDGIIIKTGSDEKIEQIISDLHKNELSFFALGPSIKSNIPTGELIQLGRFASSVRSDKVVSLDLAQSSITESKLLPDSTRVLGVNHIQLDTFIRDNLSDTAITDEGATISVLNATTHPGLAEEAARRLTNLGANVIFTGNTESLQGKSVVVERSDEPDKYSVTAARLEEMFAPWCEKDPCSSPDPRVTGSRAQIVLVLGEDFYVYWNKR